MTDQTNKLEEAKKEIENFQKHVEEVKNDETDKKGKFLVNYIGKLLVAQDLISRSEQRKEIENIIGEFGDNPEACIQIIDEHFNGGPDKIEYFKPHYQCKMMKTNQNANEGAIENKFCRRCIKKGITLMCCDKEIGPRSNGLWQYWMCEECGKKFNNL